MAKTSGKGRGGFSPRDLALVGTITVTEVRGLATMKDPAVYRDVKQAIARYEAEIGLRDRDIKLANMNSNINGVHFTTVADGKNAGIYLNSKVYDMKKKDIIARTKSAYKSGWSSKTNKPLVHTITHELAHGTWNTHHKAASSIAAGKEITKLYKDWSQKTYRKGYGKYSHTNVNEFFAESVSRIVHGTPDKYTRKIKYIIRKYKL